MHVLRRHLRTIDETTGDGVPACGVGPRYKITAEPGDVNCLRCRRSTEYPRPDSEATQSPEPEATPEAAPLLTWRDAARERAERRHARPVIGAAADIHAITVGSMDGLTREDIASLVAWLRWRVTDGWDPAQEASDAFDECVRALAIAALAEHDARARGTDALQADEPSP